jgi:hypothetical protein
MTELWKQKDFCSLDREQHDLMYITFVPNEIITKFSNKIQLSNYQNSTEELNCDKVNLSTAD